MKYIKNIGLGILMMGLMSGCILENQDPEYDIVGAVGTISGIEVSNSAPEVGESVNFRVTFYSEHESATELSMNLMEGDSRSNLETRTFSDWNTEDSYVETFTYQVPEGSEGSSITVLFELLTVSEYSTTREVTLSVVE